MLGASAIQGLIPTTAAQLLLPMARLQLRGWRRQNFHPIPAGWTQPRIYCGPAGSKLQPAQTCSAPGTEQPLLPSLSRSQPCPSIGNVEFKLIWRPAGPGSLGEPITPSPGKEQGLS